MQNFLFLLVHPLTSTSVSILTDGLFDAGSRCARVWVLILCRRVLFISLNTSTSPYDVVLLMVYRHLHWSVLPGYEPDQTTIVCPLEPLFSGRWRVEIEFLILTLQ